MTLRRGSWGHIWIHASLFLLLALISLDAFAFSGARHLIRPMAKLAGALPDTKVISYADRIVDTGDLTRVRAEIESLGLSREALGDLYTRIAIRKGLLTRDEAEALYRNLNKVDGYSATLAKTLGVSQAQRVGHLSELRHAMALKQDGVQVIAIGRQFNDHIKMRPTDIDLLAKQGRVVAAVELKAYTSADMFRLTEVAPKDMASIRVFCQTRLEPSRCVPVFAVSEQPGAQMDNWLQKNATANGVELVYGTGTRFSEQISTLLKVKQ
jgi:Holliday junction resolvase-like predicted endonuclease